MRFESRALPESLAGDIRSRLAEEHRRYPLSTIDSRGTVRRVRLLLDEVGVRATVYRGGLQLRGAEVDHVWLGILPGDPGREEAAASYVVDAVFPLFAQGFVDVLREFVAGDASTEDLARAAMSAGPEQRVIGTFPAPLGYVGKPVWSGAR